MSYVSTLQYLPGDTFQAISMGSLKDLVPTIAAADALQGFPVAWRMTDVFELMWRVKRFRFVATVNWETIVPGLTGQVSIDGVVNKVTSPDATEITWAEYLNPNWCRVTGTSESNNGVDPPTFGTAVMSFDFADETTSMRRLASAEPDTKFNVWLPNIGMTIRDELTGGLSAAMVSTVNNPDLGFPVGTFRYNAGAATFASILYASTIVSGTINITSADAVVTPIEWWTYAPNPGYNIWGESTGARVNSPFSAQR